MPVWSSDGRESNTGRSCCHCDTGTTKAGRVRDCSPHRTAMQIAIAWRRVSIVRMPCRKQIMLGNGGSGAMSCWNFLAAKCPSSRFCYLLPANSRHAV